LPRCFPCPHRSLPSSPFSLPPPGERRERGEKREERKERGKRGEKREERALNGALHQEHSDDAVEPGGETGRRQARQSGSVRGRG